MSSKDFSKSELVKVLEIIDATYECSSASKLRQILSRTKELIGADFCISGFGKFDEDINLDDFLIVNGDYPEEWLKLYLEKGLYKADPIVKHHTSFVATQFWTDTYKQYDDEVTHKFLSCAEDFGLKWGMSSGVFDPVSGKTSIFSFACRKKRPNKHHKKIIDEVVLHLHKAIAGIRRI